MAPKAQSTSLTDRIILTADKLRQALMVCMVATRGAITLGSPGGGKTANHRGLAKATESAFLATPPLPTMDPTDLRGIPKVVEIDGLPRTIWTVPNFLPTTPPSSPSGLGIVLADDFTTAPPAVQAPFYQLWLEGHLGDYVMPEGWLLFATANYDTDRAGTHRSLTPMRSRWVTLHLGPDVETFARGAVSAWEIRETVKLPKLPPRPRPIRPEILAFLRFRPTLLNDFNPDALSYPCERSWEIASDLLYAMEAMGGVDPMVEHALYAGSVGVGTAAEVLGFLRHYRSLPDIPGIIRNPKKAIVPKEPAALYAVTAALGRAADAKNFGPITEYLDRLPTEYAVFTVRDAARRTDGTKDAVGRTKEFIDWANRNQGVIL
jgi:hypothetical protein